MSESNTQKRIGFFLDNVRLPVTKCKKPTMRNYRGRTWDTGYILLNGKRTEVYLDTSWGEWIYFIYDNSWRKLKMMSSNLEDLKGKTWNVDPFSIEKSDIKIV